MKKSNKLIFMGIKHSGKSTFSKRTAEHYNIDNFDLDEEIEKDFDNTPVRNIYSDLGKERFDSLQYEKLKELLDNDKRICISLGGGAADTPALMKMAKENGLLLYIYRKEEDMLPVILKHGLPSFLDKDDISGSFHKIYTRRDKIYSEYADLKIDLGPYGDKDQTESKILGLLEENGYGI